MALMKRKHIKIEEPEIKLEDWCKPPVIVRFFEDGWRMGILVSVGYKHGKLIPMNSKNIKIVKVTKDEIKGFLPQDEKSSSSLKDAVEKFLEVGRRVGITKSAEELLMEIA